MKVKHLIKLLKNFDQNLDVVVHQGKFSFSKANSLKMGWYQERVGSFDEAEDEDDMKTSDALLIGF